MRDEKRLALVRHMEALVREELNVKKVIFDRVEEHVVTISAKANFKKLGKLFGPKMKEAAAAIEKFSSEQIHALEKGGTINVAGRPIGIGDIEIRRTKREGVEVETGAEMTVALDTAITPSLKNEGLAREFINRVQNLRKDADLAVADRIKVIYDTDSKEITDAVTQFSDYIKSETLTVELAAGKSPADTKQEACEIEDINVTIGIIKI